MDDDRVVGRPALRREHARDGPAIGRVGAKAVDGLRGKGDEFPLSLIHISSHEPTAQNSRPLTTKMNSPSVSTVTGSVSSSRIGRISVLMRPSTSAATSAVANESTRIDGMM